MRGQEQQVQPFRNRESSTLVPARLIEHQEQVFLWPHPLFVSESCEREGKGRSIDRRHEKPTGLSAPGMHKPIQIYPLIARSDHGPHAGPLAGPDAAQDRLETDAVLILTPQFNACLGIRLMQASPEVVDELYEALQKASSTTIRLEAARLLGQIGRGDSATVDVLLSGLLDEDDEVRSACAQALARLGKRRTTMPPLIEEHLVQAIQDPQFGKPDRVRGRPAYD